MAIIHVDQVVKEASALYDRGVNYFFALYRAVESLGIKGVPRICLESEVTFALRLEFFKALNPHITDKDLHRTEEAIASRELKKRWARAMRAVTKLLAQGQLENDDYLAIATYERIAKKPRAPVQRTAKR